MDAIQPDADEDLDMDNIVEVHATFHDRRNESTYCDSYSAPHTNAHARDG